MDLIDEEDGAGTVEEAVGTRLLYDIAHVLHAAIHRRKGVKGTVEALSDDLSQRRLANSGRPPEDEGGDAPAFYHITQHCSLAYKVLLADIIVKARGTESFC